MARLPSVLSDRDLPLAELCAARLDGEVVELGGEYVPIDEPDLAELRARILLQRIGDAPVIVERRSAAWLRGAMIAPPSRPQVCVPATARISTRRSRDYDVREVAIDDADIAPVGGLLRATTAARTAFDLVRDAGADAARSGDAVVELLRLDPTLAAAVHERLRAAHRLPNKAVAQLRLDTAIARAGRLGDQPSETR